MIVDDEPDAQEVLNLRLNHFPDIEVVGTAFSVDEGIEAVRSTKPELIFLDVELSEKSGFDLLRAFPKPDFKVIFVTAFEQYAIRAIKHSALDYILKPVQLDELGLALERITEERTENDERLEHLAKNVEGNKALERLVIASKKGFITLEIKNIISIEARSGNYAFFFLADGRTHLCTKPLTYYDELLSENGFVRIHRSHLVNLKHIKKFDNTSDTVLMSNQKQLPVAARRRSHFRKQLLK